MQLNFIALTAFFLLEDKTTFRRKLFNKVEEGDTGLLSIICVSGHNIVVSVIESRVDSFKVTILTHAFMGKTQGKCQMNTQF